MKVSIDAERLKKRLNGMSARAKNTSPALRVVGRLGVRSIQRTFAAEGRPQKWPPSADAYVLSKVKGNRKKAKKNKLLVDTGELINSIGSEVGRHYVDIGPGLLPYAKAHHYGCTKKVSVTKTSSRGKPFSYEMKMNIPARPYVILQDKDKEEIEKILGRYILEGANAAG